MGTGVISSALIKLKPNVKTSIAQIRRATELEALCRYGRLAGRALDRYLRMIERLRRIPFTIMEQTYLVPVHWRLVQESYGRHSGKDHDQDLLLYVLVYQSPID